MDDFIDVDADDRTFAFLLKEGIQDGGQWDMFVALVEKIRCCSQISYAGIISIKSHTIFK